MHSRRLVLLLLGVSLLAGCADPALVGEHRDASVDTGPLPPFSRAEECGNGLDDDDNGRIDDGCPCGLGETQACFAGAIASRQVGTCTDGVQTCAVASGIEWGDWGDAPCVGGVAPAAEQCDGMDHDCDGARDEDCPCTAGATQGCGLDEFLTAPCMGGTQTCRIDGTWSACEGAVGPTPDRCLASGAGDGINQDCDETTDEGCGCIPEPEVCRDGRDNDCDGEIDEPACTPDWPPADAGVPDAGVDASCPDPLGAPMATYRYDAPDTAVDVYAEAFGARNATLGERLVPYGIGEAGGINHYFARFNDTGARVGADRALGVGHWGDLVWSHAGGYADLRVETGGGLLGTLVSTTRLELAADGSELARAAVVPPEPIGTTLVDIRRLDVGASPTILWEFCTITGTTCSSVRVYVTRALDPALGPPTLLYSGSAYADLHPAVEIDGDVVFYVGLELRRYRLDGTQVAAVMPFPPPTSGFGGARAASLAAVAGGVVVCEIRDPGEFGVPIRVFCRRFSGMLAPEASEIEISTDGVIDLCGTSWLVVGGSATMSFSLISASCGLMIAFDVRSPTEWHSAYFRIDPVTLSVVTAGLSTEIGILRAEGDLVAYLGQGLRRPPIFDEFRVYDLCP